MKLDFQYQGKLYKIYYVKIVQCFGRCDLYATFLLILLIFSSEVSNIYKLLGDKESNIYHKESQEKETDRDSDREIQTERDRLTNSVKGKAINH